MRSLRLGTGQVETPELSLMILFNQQFFILVQLFNIVKKYPMITTRSTTPRPPLLKYSYKTTNTPARSNYTQNDLTSKKDSRLKSKNNQKTHHNSSFQASRPKEWREPLAEVKQDNLQKCLDLADYHKRESLALRKKNEMLEDKVTQQGKEIQDLKQEIINIKQSVALTINNQSIRQPQAHRYPEDKFVHRNDQLGFLRHTHSQLKDYHVVDNQNTFANVQIGGVGDPNEISRRKEYIQHYQQIAGAALKDGDCQACQRRQSLFEDMKMKYSDELRNLQEQLVVLREKKLMSEVLEQQVANKNECIDYLTQQLSSFESNSAHLLSIIDSLQRRLETMEDKHTRRQSWREKGNSSFHSFSDYKY